MQTLKLADDLFEDFEGGKRVTIRNGKRDISLGLLLFEGVDDLSLRRHVAVDTVVHSTLRNLPDYLFASDGFVGPDDAVSVLSRFYPDITLDSEVTAIGFEVA